MNTQETAPTNTVEQKIISTVRRGLNEVRLPENTAPRAVRFTLIYDSSRVEHEVEVKKDES